MRREKLYNPSANELRIDSTLGADGKYSGITETGTSAQTISFGDLVYFGGNGRWALTNAVSASLSGGKLGICLVNAVSSGSYTNVLLYGKVRADARFPTMATGSAVYVGLTSGSIQTWQPSGSDQAIRVVGFVNTSDELYFCPSPDYMTHI